MTSVSVVIPTYNEAGNIVRIIAAVRPHVTHVVVVDDGSPDGTAARAAEAAHDDPGVVVINRGTKEGLGPAYAAGFGAALAGSPDVVCQMDADFSHDPADLPRLIEAVTGGAGLAIGSRYVAGGATAGWAWYRRQLSRWGNRYAAVMLRVGVRDATAGFRAWSAETLRAVRPETCAATGYGFQVEMAWRASRSGVAIVELPVLFREREVGVSKMSLPIALEAMWLVTRWGVRSRLGSLRARE